MQIVNEIMSASGAAMSATVTTLQMTNIMSMVASETTTTQLLLMEPTSPFPLWSIALITLSVLVVTSMVFVMTVLLCRILKERRNKCHTYNTRSQQGSYNNIILHESIALC